MKNSKPTAIKPRIIVRGSIKAPPINFRVTTSIIETAEAFTPSKNAPNIADFLSLGINGLVAATNKNEGKNIPTVATAAPFHPLSI